MSWKPEVEELRESLAADTRACIQATNGFISSATPLYNKLKDMTGEQIAELLPKKFAKGEALRDFLIAEAVDLKAKMETLRGLLLEM